MKVVCCPDSFKESLSAVEAASAIASGVLRVWPAATVVEVPLADGGEGTCVALTRAMGGELFEASCLNAVGEQIVGQFGFVESEKLAIVDAASACGIELVPMRRRDAEVTSSVGVGQLIAAALGFGAKRMVIGLGGTATNDAGAGLMSALGVRFLDADGGEVPLGGVALARLAAVDVSGLDSRLSEVSFEVAVDVDIPLLGFRGASAVFGPQKGATSEGVERLDAALTRWADVVEPALGVEVRNLPGAGAGGGLGAALAAFLGAKLVPGIELVMDAVGLASAIVNADLVLTGEGLVDGQSASGKVPWGVADLAHSFGVPVVVLGGGVTETAEVSRAEGIVALVPILREVVSLPVALVDGAANLERATVMVCQLVQLGIGLGCVQS